MAGSQRIKSPGLAARGPLTESAGSARGAWLPSIALAAGVGVVFFVATRLSLLLLTQPDGVAVFWPAAGFAAGVMIVGGRSARWPVAVGVIAAVLAVHHVIDGPIGLTVLFALVNAVEALATAWLVEHLVEGRFSLRRLMHVLWLVVAAVISAAVVAIASALGVTLINGPAVPITVTWMHLFSANVGGIVTTAPLIIAIASVIRTPPRRREIIEGGAALIAVVAATAALIFLVPRAWWDRIAPVELLLPLLLWIAARCRPAFTSVAVFIISLAIAGAAIFGLGHFGAVGPSEAQGVYAARCAVLGVAIFSYVLAALFAEQRQAERNQKTLTSELQHRTNNLLTLVQTIANRTLSDSDPRKEKQILEARLQALARANRRLTESDWSGLTLDEIIRSELEAYLSCCDIEGGRIVIDRQYAQSFSLVLHELATNAIKYGALSTREGRVHISWGPKGNGRDRQMVFRWREQGGPPVIPPKRRGFGSRLLTATFARTRSSFDPDGFSCEIEVPLREVEVAL